MRGRRIWMTTEASSGVHVDARRRCPRETPDSARSASSRAVCNAETRYRPSRNDRKKTAASKIKRIRTHRLPVFSGFISLLQTKALFFIPYHPLRLPVKQKRRILFGIAESYRKSAPFPPMPAGRIQPGPRQTPQIVNAEIMQCDCGIAA